MHITSIDDAAWASPWRHRRVSEKVGLCLGLLLTALTAPTWPAAPLVMVAVVVFALAWAKIPPKVFAIIMMVPLAFIVIGVLTIGISVGGSPSSADLFRWGPFSASTASLSHAGQVLGRSLGATSAMLLLAMTTPMVDLLTWCRRLRVPDVLLEIASLIYRMLFLLLESVLGVREAQRNRLLDAAPRRQRWKGTADGMGSIMTRAWQRAQRMEDGLAARGYENALVTLPVARSRDWRFVGLGLVVLATIWTLSLVIKGLS